MINLAIVLGILLILSLLNTDRYNRMLQLFLLGFGCAIYVGMMIN